MANNIQSDTKSVPINIKGKNISPYQKNDKYPEDIGRPSLIDWNSSDFLTRESLGILSNSFLGRNSLTRDQLNLEFMKNFGGSNISPRESLGILDLSALELGRDSLQIFDLRESLVRHKSTGGIKDVKSPIDRVPLKIMLDPADDIVDNTSLGFLNQGVLFTDSEKLSTNSSVLSYNPHFSFKSTNEPSPILPLNYETFQEVDSKLVISDPMNQAFQFSNLDNKCSMSQIITPTTPENKLTESMHRIKSLPSTLQENAIQRNNSEQSLDDSVFLEGKKIAIEISNSYCFEDKSSDSVKCNLLDSIAEPNWPSDLDVSQNLSEPKEEYNRETVSKKIDRMFDLKPVNLNEKLKVNQVANDSNDEHGDASKDNLKLKQDISPVNHSILSNNRSQNLSKISQSSNDSILRMIRNLSDFVKDKETLSTSRKNEVLNTLNSLASELSDNKIEQVLSEDSGRSSVEEQLKSKSFENSDNLENGDHSGKVEESHVLDLSCKKNTSLNVATAKRSCTSLGLSPGSSRKPPPYIPKTPKRHTLNVLNASADHIDAQKRSSNDSGAKSAGMSSKATNVSNPKAVAAGKLRKSKVGPVIVKKGPLRAVLPLENMAKGSRSHTTPERNESSKMMLKSNRTSTPIQEVTLKPTLTSTPTSYSSKNKSCAISPLSSKPKYYRSLSEKASTPTSKKPDKSKENGLAPPKTLAKSLKGESPRRRNSVSEGVTGREIKDVNSEGGMRLKRSFSTGKEHKLMSALSKVRQGILTSPYYQRPGNSNSGSHAKVLTENNKSITGSNNIDNKLSTPSLSVKPGKENVQQ
ncbi:uncharacterized protein LOC143199450 isoform X1 [Rhynchophorus ferrugineus]|uniref:uncharacterized protein LOC143199450 isoform X1 n=1 Tax=Rhynchophorus ferrugineus TaxID=354439 RepID=UPI003FCED1FE